ncbi:MAG: proteasome-activating nucleotidase, partial [Desulfurococcaceae archaeon]
MSSDLRKHEETVSDDFNVVLTDEKDYIAYLEVRLKQLEEEKKKLERKLEYYKSEIEKLLSSPLIEATVESLLPDGRVVVKSSSGPSL